MNPGEVQVTHYRVEWTASTRACRVILVASLTGQEYPLENLALHEMLALVDVLRNEKPLFFDPQTGVLRTANERVGESDGGSAMAETPPPGSGYRPPSSIEGLLDDRGF